MQKSQDFSSYKTKSNLVIFPIPKVSNAIAFSWPGRKLLFINKVLAFWKRFITVSYTAIQFVHTSV